MKFTVVAVVAIFFALGVVAKPAPQLSTSAPQLFARTDCVDVWCYDQRTGESNPCECTGSVCLQAGKSGVYNCT